MRWVNDATARYYEAHLVEDLFGFWTLITAWGRQGSPRGRIRSTGVASYDDGQQQIETIGKRRRQRGYRLLDGESAAAAPSRQTHTTSVGNAWPD